MSSLLKQHLKMQKKRENSRYYFALLILHSVPWPPRGHEEAEDHLLNERREIFQVHFIIIVD